MKNYLKNWEKKTILLKNILQSILHFFSREMNRKKNVWRVYFLKCSFAFIKNFCFFPSSFSRTPSLIHFTFLFSSPILISTRTTTTTGLSPTTQTSSSIERCMSKNNIISSGLPPPSPSSSSTSLCSSVSMFSWERIGGICLQQKVNRKLKNLREKGGKALVLGCFFEKRRKCYRFIFQSIKRRKTILIFSPLTFSPQKGS